MKPRLGKPAREAGVCFRYARRESGTHAATILYHHWCVKHALYAHIVWTTRDRERLIDARVAEFVWRYCRDIAQQLRTQILAGGIVQTHVHLLVRLHPTTDISLLMQRMKGGSSVLAVKEGHCARGRPLRWAKGYSIHSVSQQLLPPAQAYVRNQAQRHPDEAIPNWRGSLD